MEETYQLIEGSPTLRDLDAENGFLWCPFGHSGRQNEPGILISRLDDGSYDVRLGTGFDSPERFATGDPDWSWMDLSVASTVELTFADDMALNDWIASETTATGAAWARCFNPYCGPDEKTLNTSEIIDTLRRFESPSYIVRGPIEDIESLPVGYYWCPDALDPDPSYNGYLLNVSAAATARRRERSRSSPAHTNQSWASTTPSTGAAAPRASNSTRTSISTRVTSSTR